MWEVINKKDKIFLFSSGGYRERSTDIKEDPFLDYTHFVVPVMECRFYVLPQGTSFAYIMLLKCSFREASGYSLYNVQGAMMQMAKSYVLKFTYITTLQFLFLGA